MFSHFVQVLPGVLRMKGNVGKIRLERDKMKLFVRRVTLKADTESNE